MPGFAVSLRLDGEGAGPNDVAQKGCPGVDSWAGKTPAWLKQGLGWDRGGWGLGLPPRPPPWAAAPARAATSSLGYSPAITLNATSVVMTTHHHPWIKALLAGNQAV